MASKLDLAEKITTIGQGQGYTVGQMLPLDSIRIDGGTQARAGLNEETVVEYAETWLNLSHRQNGFLEMPPIVVFHDGESYWLADGFHRVEAYKRFVHGPSASASAKAIRAEIRSGTRRDAVLYACGANASHGLKRTAADKRRAIERVLGDEEWRQWSDSEIGRRCQVDHKTVAAVRAELYPGNSQDSRTVERGGTTYQQKPPAQKPNISELAPITIATDKGPREIRPLYANGTLALHDVQGSPHAEAITHIASGKRIASFARHSSAGRAFDRLAELEWSQIPPDGAMPPAMALLVARILVSFDDVDSHAARLTRLKELEAKNAFWQSIDAHHPTAHLWTRERPDLLRSACGMTIQNRLPNGSTEGGHCSNCARATWPQNQAPEIAQPHPAAEANRQAMDMIDRTSHTTPPDLFAANLSLILEPNGWIILLRGPGTTLTPHHYRTAEAAIAFAREHLMPPSPGSEAERIMRIPWPAPAPPRSLTVCVRCGAERSEHRTLTSYEAGLVLEYPSRTVTLCSVCIPILLRERAERDASTTPPETAMAAEGAPDPRGQILALLEQIVPLMRGLKTDDQMGLSQAIADLNECQEGTEAAHWLRVGFALLDLEMEEHTRTPATGAGE